MHAFQNEILMSRGVSGEYSHVTDGNNALCQVRVWRLVREVLMRNGVCSEVLLLGVDPYKERPKIQPWLNKYFRGLFKRRGGNVSLSPACLNVPISMELFTNIMRVDELSASGLSSADYPLIYHIAVVFSSLEVRAMEDFLSNFDFGHCWGRPYGSFPSEYRHKIKSYLLKAGYVVVHLKLGIHCGATIYPGAGIFDECVPIFSEFLEKFHGPNGEG